MKKGLSDITLIIDRSGSMASIAAETVLGIKKFVADQRAVPGEAVLSITQFDQQIEQLFVARPLADVPEIALVPRGATALLDAIGETIDGIGRRLKHTVEAAKPERVVVVIITDGYENASTKYDMTKINSMITLQADVYKWDFVFLGANQDAIASGSKIGTVAANSLSYGANAAGVAAAYEVTSKKLSSARSAGVPMAAMSYSAEDRAAAMGGEPAVTTTTTTTTSSSMAAGLLNKKQKEKETTSK